mmetsp:Transcript_67341/g.219363  ORF Transcript_67341/g.219363 Transcript_67341/m.219363 type:complete len:272 (-) Transcript_67341:289-1104(-)
MCEASLGDRRGTKFGIVKTMEENITQELRGSAQAVRLSGDLEIKSLMVKYHGGEEPKAMTSDSILSAVPRGQQKEPASLNDEVMRLEARGQPIAGPGGQQQRRNLRRRLPLTALAIVCSRRGKRRVIGRRGRGEWCPREDVPSGVRKIENEIVAFAASGRGGRAACRRKPFRGVSRPGEAERRGLQPRDAQVEKTTPRSSSRPRERLEQRFGSASRDGHVVNFTMLNMLEKLTDKDDFKPSAVGGRKAFKKAHALQARVVQEPHKVGRRGE